MTQITVTVLGCGSSSGTPVIGCDCPACISTDPKNRRTRCSAHVQIGEQYWQIDTGTDFYHQALQHKLQRIDGVLYTHPHADHLNGIDDLRAFCYRQRAAISITDTMTPCPIFRTVSIMPFWNRITIGTGRYYVHMNCH